MVGRNDANAGRTRDVQDLREDLTAVDIEHDRSARVHVIYIKTCRRRIEALVVESIRRTGERDFTQQLEPGRGGFLRRDRRRTPRCWCHRRGGRVARLCRLGTNRVNRRKRGAERRHDAQSKDGHVSL